MLARDRTSSGLDGVVDGDGLQAATSIGLQHMLDELLRSAADERATRLTGDLLPRSKTSSATGSAATGAWRSTSSKSASRGDRDAGPAHASTWP